MSCQAGRILYFLNVWQTLIINSITAFSIRRGREIDDLYCSVLNKSTSHDLLYFINNYNCAKIE